MTTYNLTDQPRIADGTFTTKTQGIPEIGLTYPELPAYDPTFFYDRIGQSKDLREVKQDVLAESEQALVRNATQAINDTWALEHGRYETGRVGTFVDTTVYRDGRFLVADIQHKDQNDAPYGSLVVFSADGSTVGTFDNVSDEFGERWIPMTGLRAQLVADLNESSADGSLGDQL